MKNRTSSAILSAALAVGLAAASTPPANARQSSPPSKKPAAKSPSKSSSATKSSKKRSSRRRVTGQRAPTTDRIREIQSALASAGAYSAAPNGKWDEPTVAAFKKFQQSKGLNPDGKLDAKTLQALGLGSKVAGLAPPRPNSPQPPSASNFR